MAPPRGRPLLRDLHRNAPRIVRAEGVYLYDDEGRRYLDGVAGAAAVNNIGHGRTRIAEVMARQARTVAYTPSFCFSSPPLEELADLVAAITPGDLNNLWYVNGGSEACEGAVKIAHQHFAARGLPAKQIVISRWQSYHGNSLGALGFGGQTVRRRHFSGMFQDQAHIEPAFPYRCAYARGEGACCRCDLSCAAGLEREIHRLGPENVAAFIAEPVVGAALGAVPAPPGYFQAIREICDRNDVLFICDEVLTGFGRTGAAFGIEHWGVVPDLMACGKAMGSGYVPLGAAIVSDRVLAPIVAAGENIVGGTTYSAHTLSCAVGVEVLRIMVEERLFERSARIGDYLLRKLGGLATHPLVGDVRGLGMVVGLELVMDKEIKRPFPPALGLNQLVLEESLRNGIVIYCTGGTLNGTAGDNIMLTPPLTLSKAEADVLIAGLARTLDAVAARLGASGAA